MNIKSSGPDRLYFRKAKRLIRLLTFRKFLLALVVTVMLGIYGMGAAYYGMVLNRNKIAESLSDIMNDIAFNRLGMVHNYVRRVTATPERIRLDVAFEDFQKLAYFREISLARGKILADVKDEAIPAQLTHRGKMYAVKLKMTGMHLDHLAHPEKWSFRVKVKGQNTVLGMKEFALLRPETRGMLSEWINHMLEKREGLMTLRFDFVDVTINGKHKGIYALEEHFEKRLVENNKHREGILFKPGIDKIHVYNRKKVENNPALKKQLPLLEQLWSAFLAGDIPASRVFDVNKLATHYAITDLVNGHHAHALLNVRYFFNPITNLLEPVGREWDPIRYSDRKRRYRDMVLFIEDFREWDGFYHRLIFRDPIFSTKYIKQLEHISKREFLDEFFNEIDSEMQEKLGIIAKENPFYTYPKELLYKNQKYIRAKLNAKAPSLAAYYQGKRDGRLALALRNLHSLPLEIMHGVLNGSVSLESTQNIVWPANIAKPASDYLLAEFTIPEGVEWSNEEVAGLEIYYKILGIDKVRKAMVFPWSAENAALSPRSLNRQVPNYQQFDFLEVDESAKIIAIKAGKFTLDRDLIIPKGYTVICHEGVSLNLMNGAKIVSYSPLQFRGSEKFPIRIHSTDSSGQGLVVLNADAKSVMKHVIFENLSNPSQNGWELTGAVTFYESPVHISQSQFVGNRSEDGLNIIRSEFSIQKTLFKQTFSDAFDSDFANGVILDTSFVACGNDAIDISGSEVGLKSIVIDGAGDKGLSVGEKSQVTVENIVLRNAEIGVASKDLSTVSIGKLNISGGEIGITAYQKKSEYGPSAIKIASLEMDKVSIPYLVEENSTLMVGKKLIEPSHINVKEILYGVEYGKSSK